MTKSKNALPTVDEFAEKHALSAEASKELAEIVADAVANADTAGYIRGRNEKIEVINRFDCDVAAKRNANVPRYTRRGFWESNI